MRRLIAAAVLGGLALTAGITTTALASPRAAIIAPGAATSTVFACAGSGGTFDYYEFRSPLPHPCFYSGEYLEQLPVIVLAVGAQFPLSLGGVSYTCRVAAATGSAPVSVGCAAASP